MFLMLLYPRMRSMSNLHTRSVLSHPLYPVLPPFGTPPFTVNVTRSFTSGDLYVFE